MPTIPWDFPFFPRKSFPKKRLPKKWPLVEHPRRLPCGGAHPGDNIAAVAWVRSARTPSGKGSPVHKPRFLPQHLLTFGEPIAQPMLLQERFLNAKQWRTIAVR
jgi:hypothetical protein